MKERMTALALAVTMIATISAFAATAEDEPLRGAAQTAETSPASEDAAKTAALEIFGGTADAETEVFAAEETTDEEPAEEPETETAPEPDAEGTLSFANLRSRMKENFYPVLVLEESVKSLEELDYDDMYERMRKQLNELARMEWGAIQYSAIDPSASIGAAQLDSAYNALREKFDDIKEGKMQEDNNDILWQLRDGENAVYIAGENLYIMILSYQMQDAAATRGLGQMDRNIRALELRQKLGQVSALNVNQLKNMREQTASQQQSLRTGIEVAMLQLKNMVGVDLSSELMLAALPKVTAKQLSDMDIEADLESAKKASYELRDAEKTFADAKEDYHDALSKYGPDSKRYELNVAKHDWQAAQYSHDHAIKNFELNFRTLYAQVKDAAQVLSAKRAALASQEKSYAASALKHKQGSISANALQDAKDELATAKDNVSSAERDLFSKYRAYQWAVEYGILNGNN